MPIIWNASCKASDGRAAGAGAGALFGVLPAAAAGVKYDRARIVCGETVGGAVAGAAEGEKDKRNIDLTGRG